MEVHRYSLEVKNDKLRAVHLRDGPIGKFLYGALKMGASIVEVSMNPNGTVHIGILIDSDLIDEFEENTGFGLQK